MILEDLRTENFSTKEVVVYGIIYPLALMMVLVAVRALE